MKSLRLIAESTYTAWVFVVGLSILWHYRIEQEVPKPYLVRRLAVLLQLGELGLMYMVG